MEHRHSKRINMELDAMIYSRGDLVASGKIRNVSLGGAFISIGHKLDIGSRYVEIALVTGVLEIDSCRINALVMHRRQGGIGVIIDENQPEAALLLVQPPDYMDFKRRRCG